MILGSPYALKGGGEYFTKLSINNTPIYVQLPKCSSTNGIVTTKRNSYIDLLYRCEDNQVLLDWLTALEDSCRELIDQKKSMWFSNDPSRSDITRMMGPISREFISGKKIIVRGNIDLHISKESDCRIYDEKETEITDVGAITPTIEFIPLICIEGIKFSTRTIEIVLRVQQIMTLSQSILKNACMIRRSSNDTSFSNNIKKSNQESCQSVNLDRSNMSNPLRPSSVQNTSVQNTSVHEISEGLPQMKLIRHNNIINDAGSEASKYSNKHLVDSSMRGGDIPLGEINELPADLDTKLANKLKEVTVTDASATNTIVLKEPDEVYYNLYKVAKEKAKQMKKEAVHAYFEAKQIKTKYRLQDLEESEVESSINTNY